MIEDVYKCEREREEELVQNIQRRIMRLHDMARPHYFYSVNLFQEIRAI